MKNCILCGKIIDPNKMKAYLYRGGNPEGWACHKCAYDGATNYRGRAEEITLGFVYILSGKIVRDRHQQIQHYVGSTKRPLYKRFAEHVHKIYGKSYTARMTDLRIAYWICMDAHYVIRIEKYLKAHRRVGNTLVGKWDNTTAVEMFWDYCKENDIPILDTGVGTI